MKSKKVYMFILVVFIITISLAILIDISKKKSATADVTNNNIQKIYKSSFKNLNNSISEEEKRLRVEATEKAIGEFEKLPIDTPYNIYDKLYEEIANNYIKNLPSVEYKKYFQVLDTLEQKFLDNPNRQY